MNGQWIGYYRDTISFLLVVELDDKETHFEGFAYIYYESAGLPSFFAHIRSISKSNVFEQKLNLFPKDAHGNTTTWERVRDQFPGVTFTEQVTVKFEHNHPNLNLQWETEDGRKGSVSIPKSRAEEKTEYQPLSEVKSWDEFKSFSSQLDYRRFIFRGQKKSLRLRTSFHRTGRADLCEFMNKDIRVLHRHLSQRTKHIFNLELPDQNGAFFNLVQHHGYPTPLLDWTFSPFVAAFFAFRHIDKKTAEMADESEKVRIFVFDQKEWCARYTQMVKLVGPPHFSILEFIAIENERMIPQQAISSVTNVDDIESYIKAKETSEVQYLRVIDLPVKERTRIMRELSTMGITAGSMFPGLDGACEELRERYF